MNDAMPSGYAELCCLSAFSFQHGASHPQELVRQAKALGYAAIAITDECTLAGIVRAHETALKEDIQLIVGSQFRFPDGDRLVLLAPDHDAYTQICELITLGRRRSVKGSYRLDREDFIDAANRCFGLWLPGRKPGSAACRWFRDLVLAGRWLAYGNHLEQDSEIQLAQLCRLGEESGIALVAVGDVRYHIRERRFLHDVMTAVRLKTTVADIGTHGLANGEHFLRPLETLKRLYPAGLMRATLEIAQHCRFSLGSLRYVYPHELTPVASTPDAYLRTLTYEGARQRWPNGISDRVRSLLEKELALIAELNYAAFFLTVHDLCRYARSRGILCQGRGSAANSAICYALGVTEVDPARGEMLFERFISKERNEPPDIDIDFEHQRREEVIQYIYTKYGRDRAAIAATVISYRRKSAVQDVGKALGLPHDLVLALSKRLQWFDAPDRMPAALSGLGFDPQSRIARQFVMLVNELIGFPRHLSQHVGGFVISEHPLSSLVPVQNATMADRTLIEWDKDDLDTLGLLKVDCLALGMLSAIRRTLEMVGRWRGREFRLQDIPAEDPATYDMLCKADSIGVFQVESRAQQTMLPRLKPRAFYDLVIETAIIRPGPIQGGMVHPFLRRRMGLEEITYPSDALRAVLDRTCGVPLFQEQVMQIAMVAAGFSPGEADQVRRNMAAWRRKGGLEQYRDKLLSGMAARGYTPEFAESIYQQILGFSGYGFPESHAASFALLAYASSWLKCHWPAAFLAGLLNSQPMGFYSPSSLIFDAKRHGVVLLPVDARISEWDCTLEAIQGDPKPAVRLGLREIRGLIEEQAQSLIAERVNAPFVDVDDLAHRAKLSRRSMSLLAGAGALAGLAGHRRNARWSTLGVEQLPGMLAGHAASEAQVTFAPPSEGQDLAADYQAMGFTQGRHPMALLRTRLRKRAVRSADELALVRNGKRVRVGGLVTHRQMPETASGVMFVSLEDETGITNVIVWKRIQEQCRHDLLGSNLLIVEGECQSEMGIVHVVAHRMRDITAWLGTLRTESRDFA